MRPVFNQAAGPLIAGAVIGWPRRAGDRPAGIASVLSAWCYVVMVRSPAATNPPTPAKSVRSGCGHRHRRRCRRLHVAHTVAVGDAVLRDHPGGWPRLVRSRCWCRSPCAIVPAAMPVTIAGADGVRGRGRVVVVGVRVDPDAAPLPDADVRDLGRSSVPPVAMGFAHSTWMFVVTAFVLGVFFDGPDGHLGTLLQRRVPPHLLGRVSSLDFFVSVCRCRCRWRSSHRSVTRSGTRRRSCWLACCRCRALVFYLAAWLWRDEIEHPLRDEPSLWSLPIRGVGYPALRQRAVSVIAVQAD